MKNTIIYWKGGGYDGCIWEPNMGFFDGDGEWHPIISTGCGALDTVDDVEAEMKKQEDPNVPDYEKTDLLTFPIEGEHPLEWLCNHVRIDFVAVLADALAEAGYSVDMKCDCCGEWFSSDDYKFGDIVGIMSNSGFYKGDGGVGVIVTDIWCDNCRQDSECPVCCGLSIPVKHGTHEADVERMDFEAKFGYDMAGVCEYCWDQFVRRHDCKEKVYHGPDVPETDYEMERIPGDVRICDLLETLEEAEDAKTPADPKFAAECWKYFDWKKRIEGLPVGEAFELMKSMALRDPDNLPKLGHVLLRKFVENTVGPVAKAYFDGIDGCLMDLWKPHDLEGEWSGFLELGKETI